MPKHIHIWVHDKDTSPEDEKWITINGVHVRIDKEGVITAGPKGFVGKKPGDLKEGPAGKSEPKAEPKPASKPAEGKKEAPPEEGKEPTKKGPAPILWTKHGGGDFSEAERARLKALRVPPAWTEIKLSEDPKAALQVVGKDAKGRAQYLYSAEHSAKAAAEKFARLKAFNGVATKVVTNASRDMIHGKTPKQRDAAAVIRLISETGFRVGSEADTGADVQAHGATTLTGEHVKVKGNTLSFDFIGKKGVKITKTLEHPELARYIGGKLKENPTGKIFDVSDSQVREYLASAGGQGFKVKDFRTWNGTNMALKVISEHKPPTTAAEFKKMRAEVGKKVSEHLGNTPTVALESYIDPTVFAKWSHLQ